MERIKYKEVNFWNNLGLIQENYSIEHKLKIATILGFAKSILLAKSILENDHDFYHDVSFVLYPTIIYYIIKENMNDDELSNMIHKFIFFCESYLKLKYDLNNYNDDYLLIMDFIKNNDKK